jgi:PAS domain S-box-containing protein
VIQAFKIKLKKILHFKRIATENEELVRKIPIAGIFNLISLVANLIFILIGLLLDIQPLYWLNTILFILFSFTFYLYKQGYIQSFFLSFLIIVNVATFFLNLFLGFEGGGYLYFFPIMLINFYFFSYEQRKQIFISVSLSFFLLLLLILEHHFLIFNRVPFLPQYFIVFEINLLLSVSFILYWINYTFKENYKINNKLTKEKANIEAVLNNSLQNIVMVDREYHIISFNKRAFDTVKEHTGLIMKTGHLFFEYLFSDFRDIIKTKINQAFEGETLFSESSFLVDDKRFWLEVIYAPVIEPDGQVSAVIFSSFDISERKENEEKKRILLEETQRLNEELQASEEELRLSLDHTTALNQKLFESQEKLIEAQKIAKIGNWELNLSEKEINYSQEFYEILGVDKATFNKEGFRGAFKYAHPDDIEFVDNIIKDAISKKQGFKIVHRIITPQHIVKYVETIGLFVTDVKSKNDWVKGTTQDITLDKLAEEELQNKNEELRILNQELDSFVYSVSHDLRAPLASVLGLISLLKDEIDKPNGLMYLTLMEKSIHKLDVFIRSVTDYSRNTRLEVQSQPIDFQVIVDEIVENYLYLEGASKIKVDIEINQNQIFYSDENRIRVILNNLISNAFKYHNPLADLPKILIAIKTDEKLATIKIADNGIGIDQKYIDKVFGMFFRATQKSSGSGLGLYIVKQTVEKLHGKIILESNLGQGSTFLIELPNHN